MREREPKPKKPDPKLQRLKRMTWQLPVHVQLQVRNAFVEGVEDSDGKRIWPTIPQVSERFNIPFTTLRDRARLEKWAVQREEFARATEEKRRNSLSTKIGIAAAQFDSRCLRIADKLVDSCEKLHTQLFLSETGKTLRPPPLEVARLGNALRIAQLVGRTALGINGDDELITPLNAHDGHRSGFANTVRVTYERREYTPNVINSEDTADVIDNGAP